MDVPAELIHYAEGHWMPMVEDSISFPVLRAREKWRQAQDAWATAHGMDRTQFEALARTIRGGG
ncbi:hypothetical protein AB0N67_24740 [Streptomyces microflavus]|uniref:hypothetical protein n=1 Tax=Streptomyces microflavus TaxID=1919 RepID=UPI00342643F4